MRLCVWLTLLLVLAILIGQCDMHHATRLQPACRMEAIPAPHAITDPAMSAVSVPTEYAVPATGKHLPAGSTVNP